MSDAPLVLRPATAAYAGWVKRPDPATLLLVGVLVGVPTLAALGRWLVTGEAGGLVLLLALVLIGVALGLGGALLSMRTSSITLAGSTIEHRSWFVRRTVLPRAGLRGIWCDYRPPVSQKSSDLLVLQAEDGQGPRIRLNGAFWDSADLSTIAESAGVPHESRELRARDVESRLPGILRFQERRPVVFLALFPAVILLIAFGGGGLYLAFADDDRTEEFPSAQARDQDALIRDVAARAGVSWRGRSFVRVGECDAAEDGLARRVDRRAELSADSDAVERVARSVEAAARGTGLDDIDAQVTATGFEIEATDGDSSFEGGASLDVELDDGTLTLTHSTRCVAP